MDGEEEELKCTRRCNKSYMTTFYIQYETGTELLTCSKAEHFTLQGAVITEQ
jgi:hypothetical protein